MTLLKLSAAVTLFLLTANVFAVGVKEPMYGQVMFGSLKLNDKTVTIKSNDDVYEGELPDSIPYLGAAAQVIWKDDFFGYGWEGGGFFSWHNESVSYYASSGGNGTTVRVNVDNNYWSFETFMGLYASLKPVDHLRIYVGAGPLFLFATAKVENVEEPPEPTPYDTSSIKIDADSYHSDFTVGAYARAGFEFKLPNNYWIGGSVRHMKADVNLSKSVGQFDIDGDVYYLTVTKKL